MKQTDDQVPTNWISVENAFPFHKGIGDFSGTKEKWLKCVRKSRVEGEKIGGEFSEEQPKVHIVVCVFLTTVRTIIEFPSQRFGAVETSAMFPPSFHPTLA